MYFKLLRPFDVTYACLFTLKLQLACHHFFQFATKLKIYRYIISNKSDDPFVTIFVQQLLRTVWIGLCLKSVLHTTSSIDTMVALFFSQHKSMFFVFLFFPDFDILSDWFHRVSQMLSDSASFRFA
jgi:hypothetical protein